MLLKNGKLDEIKELLMAVNQKIQKEELDDQSVYVAIGILKFLGCRKERELLLEVIVSMEFEFIKTVVCLVKQPLNKEYKSLSRKILLLKSLLKITTIIPLADLVNSIIEEKERL